MHKCNVNVTPRNSQENKHPEFQWFGLLQFLKPKGNVQMCWINLFVAVWFGNVLKAYWEDEEPMEVALVKEYVYIIVEKVAFGTENQV